MAKITWTVSDKDAQNFPANENILTRKLEKISELLPQNPQKEKDNNLKFVKESFTLLKDCGLINSDIVDKLSDKRWCDASIAARYAMNPLGGVLRPKGQPVWDKTTLRYYCAFEDLEVPEDIETAMSRANKGKVTVAVICDGVTYYISNDWFSENQQRPTKPAFYAFLKVATETVCKKRWAEQSQAVEEETEPAVNEVEEQEQEIKPTETVESVEKIEEFTPVEKQVLRPLTPEDYEKITEVDLAYRILTDSGKDNPIFFKDLILEILDKKNKSVQNEAVAISEVYTMINMDSRFQHVGEGKWGLVEWNPPEAKRGRGAKKSSSAANADLAEK